jgi:adenylate kinase
MGADSMEFPEISAMRIVFLGAPGSGKGTQAVKVKSELGIAHISTGDLLRAQVRAGTPLGIKAKAVMDAGQLVSDDVVLGMLEARLAEPDTAVGFILDGYPRNLVQANALDALLTRIGQPLDVAVLLAVPSELIVSRLAGRAQAEGRKDDTPETVRERLRVYAEQTEPVVDFYVRAGKLIEVDGVGEVDEVNARILAAIRVPA